MVALPLLLTTGRPGSVARTVRFATIWSMMVAVRAIATMVWLCEGDTVATVTAVMAAAEARSRPVVTKISQDCALLVNYNIILFNPYCIWRRLVQNRSSRRQMPPPQCDIFFPYFLLIIII